MNHHRQPPPESSTRCSIGMSWSRSTESLNSQTSCDTSHAQRIPIRDWCLRPIQQNGGFPNGNVIGDPTSITQLIKPLTAQLPTKDLGATALEDVLTIHNPPVESSTGTACAAPASIVVDETCLMSRTSCMPMCVDVPMHAAPGDKPSAAFLPGNLQNRKSGPGGRSTALDKAILRSTKSKESHLSTDTYHKLNAICHRLKRISDRDVVKLTVPELIRLGTDAGFSDAKIKNMKIRRRKLKNRSSARGSASKRRSEFTCMKSAHETLLVECEELKKSHEFLQQQHEQVLAAERNAQREAQIAREEQLDVVKRVQELQAKLKCILLTSQQKCAQSDVGSSSGDEVSARRLGCAKQDLKYAGDSRCVQERSCVRLQHRA